MPNVRDLGISLIPEDGERLQIYNCPTTTFPTTCPGTTFAADHDRNDAEMAQQLKQQLQQRLAA